MISGLRHRSSTSHRNEPLPSLNACSFLSHLQISLLTVPLGCSSKPFFQVYLWFVTQLSFRFLDAEGAILPEPIHPPAKQRRIHRERLIGQLTGQRRCP